MKEVLGIDIGGVIIDRVANDNADTSFFGRNYLATTPVPGAISAISQLVAQRFGPNVHLVSKALERTQRKTMEWLVHRDFFYQTGVKAENVHFCLTREEKAPICRDLGITHFIDDKLEVHSHLAGLVTFRYLFTPEEREVERFAQFLPGVIRVQTWDELLAVLIEAD